VSAKPLVAAVACAGLVVTAATAALDARIISARVQARYDGTRDLTAQF